MSRSTRPDLTTTPASAPHSRVRRIACASATVLASAALLVAVTATGLSGGTDPALGPTTTTTTTATAPPLAVSSVVAQAEAVYGGPDQMYLSENLAPGSGPISISLTVGSSSAVVMQPALSGDALCTAAVTSYSCDRVPSSFTGVFRIASASGHGTEVIKSASGTVLRQVNLSWGLGQG